MIFIGGSLGGCDALCEILRRLPRNFPLPIAVVLHRHRESDGMLLPVVQRCSPLPVTEAEDKTPIEPGQVYLCPADYHLLLDRDCFALSTDDPVNFARPSLDVLFESGAEWKQNAAIAVVLTGAGNDGAAGAKKIIESGGLVLVQDPATCEGPWMPAAAIASTRTPHVLNLEQIAQRLIRLASSGR